MKAKVISSSYRYRSQLIDSPPTTGHHILDLASGLCRQRQNPLPHCSSLDLYGQMLPYRQPSNGQRCGISKLQSNTGGISGKKASLIRHSL